MSDSRSIFTTPIVLSGPVRSAMTAMVSKVDVCDDLDTNVSMLYI